MTARSPVVGWQWLATLLTLHVAQTCFAQEPDRISSTTAVRRYEIPRGPLIDALTRLSEQSGWPVVYRPDELASLEAPALRGRFTLSRALDRLLSRSDLSWSMSGQTIVVRAVRQAVSAVRSPDEPTDEAGTTTLADIDVFEDGQHLPVTGRSMSAFGFDKPLLETPRSVTVVDEQTIGLFDLSAVEDLVRVVPGVYTTTRFGIQGSVDIRNVPADTYFRGMKRLTLQGHGRSVLAAMDSIEVVGGPASPLYGMGKIGGYTNMWPKSGRAKTGGYLTETQGFVQASAGAYRRAEIAAGIGGPAEFMQHFDKQGGYYVYGLVEDSNSYAEDVPVKQRILQAALSVDEFLGGARLETGVSYQHSATAGALTGRFTQDLVDAGVYIRGTPLADLDLNGNGAIGYLEMHQASPVLGALTANNQPLLQTWSWPLDANGQPLPLAQFPQIAGIPQSLHDYLTLHPEADPTGELRAQGVGGPRPLSGFVPIGMALDPRTVGFGSLDLRRAAAFERELEANFLTVFFDLHLDSNPDFTLKNQLFFDGMDQFKSSNQPFSTEQTVYVVEDKLTATARWTNAPSWLRANALASINYRNTVSRGKSLFGDFSTHRTDATAATWAINRGGMTPNSTFANGYDNPILEDDGYPWGGIYRTRFSEWGIGALLDTEILGSTTLVLGARFDVSEARNVDRAGLFNAVVGTSANPGRFATSDASARGWDHGTSWNISVAQRLLRNINMYATYARSSIVLDANNNALTNAVINAGHIGAASLAEAGVKAGLWSDRLFVTLAVYQQERTDADLDDPAAVLNAYATATRTRGAELQIKLVPNRFWRLSLYGLKQHTSYDPNDGATLLVDARTLGFQDVVDAQGNVIYPAEAFLYGGRSRIVLPAGQHAFREKQGNPNLQIGMNSSLHLHSGAGLTLGGNYFSDTCSGRLCLVTLPESYVFNAGAFFKRGSFTCKFDILNLTDERYFRARTGDTLGDVLAQAMPARHWQLSVKKEF